LYLVVSSSTGLVEDEEDNIIVIVLPEDNFSLFGWQL